MSDLWPEKITSSFGKRPIKVVEKVVCSTNDLKIWAIEAKLSELELQLLHTGHSAITRKHMHDRVTVLEAQLAALRGEQ